MKKILSILLLLISVIFLMGQQGGCPPLQVSQPICPTNETDISIINLLKEVANKTGKIQVGQEENKIYVVIPDRVDVPTEVQVNNVDACQVEDMPRVFIATFGKEPKSITVTIDGKKLKDFVYE